MKVYYLSRLLILLGVGVLVFILLSKDYGAQRASIYTFTMAVIVSLILVLTTTLSPIKIYNEATKSKKTENEYINCSFFTTLSDVVILKDDKGVKTVIPLETNGTVYGIPFKIGDIISVKVELNNNVYHFTQQFTSPSSTDFIVSTVGISHINDYISIQLLGMKYVSQLYTSTIDGEIFPLEVSVHKSWGIASVVVGQPILYLTANGTTARGFVPLNRNFTVVNIEKLNDGNVWWDMSASLESGKVNVGVDTVIVSNTWEFVAPVFNGKLLSKTFGTVTKSLTTKDKTTTLTVLQKVTLPPSNKSILVTSSTIASGTLAKDS